MIFYTNFHCLYRPIISDFSEYDNDNNASSSVVDGDSLMLHQL